MIRSKIAAKSGTSCSTRSRITSGSATDYLIQADEGHGAVNPENVIQTWDAISHFLARHLGGRA